MSERPYFSIGEVLGLLLEEFSDVTISKIRFLESQGLIDPERTSSGYRKFYDGDVERLRYILREQKDHYLPLRVIKERLDDIDHTLPNPPRPVPMGASWASAGSDATEHEVFPGEPAATVGRDEPVTTEAPTVAEPGDDPQPVVVVSEPTAPPIAARAEPVVAARASVVADLIEPVIEPDPTPIAAPVLSLVSSHHAQVRAADVQLNATEFCERAGVTVATLRQLEEYGLVSGRALGTETTYDGDALRVGEVAARLLDLGLEVRHLRTWRTNAEKEMSLFEALVMPLLRQRNPQARQHATDTLNELAELGAELRGLLVDASLRAYLER